MKTLGRQAFAFLAAAMLCTVVMGQEPQRQTLGVSLQLGVSIDKVEPTSTAGKAGMKAGDYLIRVDERDIYKLDDLKAWLGEVKPGQTSVMVVLRDGDDMRLEVAFPAEFPEDGSKLGVWPGEGLLVNGIVPGSAAAKGGIKPGDRITHFNGKAVASFESLRTSIASVKAGGVAPVSVIRGGKAMKLSANFGSAPRWVTEEIIEEEEPEEEEVEEEVIEDQEIMDEGPGGIFDMFGQGGGFPGMGGIQHLMNAPAIHKDLGEAIKALRGVDNDTVRGALKKLESVHARLGKIAEAAKGLKSMTERFMGDGAGFDEMPFGGEMPDLEEIQNRISELMSEGLDIDKLRKILAEEFPGVHVEFGGMEEEPMDAPLPEKKKPAESKKKPEAKEAKSEAKETKKAPKGDR